jgi:hypothetical protein
MYSLVCGRGHHGRGVGEVGGGSRWLDGPGDEEAKIFITATLLEKLKKLKLLTNYDDYYKYLCSV